MTQGFQLIDNLYNAFNPYAPLPAGDAAYVNCEEVRGDSDILMDLGNQIKRSQHNSCYSSRNKGLKPLVLPDIAVARAVRTFSGKATRGLSPLPWRLLYLYSGH